MALRSRTQPAAARAPAGLRGLELLIGVLLVCGAVHALSMLGVESFRAVMSAREIQRLSQEVAQLELEREQLAAIVEHGSDPAFLEQLARCAGFIRPDELRYVTWLEGLTEPTPLANPCAGRLAGLW